VADGDEEVGVPPGLDHELECLHRLAAGLGGVKRRPAAREQQSALGKSVVARHLPEPIRLREHGVSRFLAGHGHVYTIRPVQGFDFVYRDAVRFRDLDGMNHVNNAVFMTYMESARIEYFRGLGLGTNPLGDLILARAEVDFRSPIEFGEEVEVGVRVGRVGTKSFDLEQELRADGRLAAEGKFVLVAYDYSMSASRELPEKWRDQLEGVAV